MIKSFLLNSDISYLIGRMGHTDSLVIGDAGLPCPDRVDRIDLSVSKGIPDFISVMEAVISAQCVEAVILADEIKSQNSGVHEEILRILEKETAECGKKIAVSYVPHEEFKKRSADCKGFIRTGECSAYANIIMVSGVTF